MKFCRIFAAIEEFIKILTVFVTCALAFGKFGMPTAVAMFGFQHLKVLGTAIAGGIVGCVIFTYISAFIIHAIHNYRAKRNLIHRKKIFTKFNRRVIRIRQRFGLAGIALITPVLGTPVGAFLAERFYKDKKKVIMYLSGSVIVWALAEYFLMLFFYDAIKGWLI
jgi:hypothetical protein